MSLFKWFQKKSKTKHGNQDKTKETHPNKTNESQAVEQTMEIKDNSKALKDKGKLFVGGLSFSTTSEGLNTYFSQFGKVVDSVVMKFPNTGKSRGFGFVTFAEPSQAEVALKNDSHVLDGKLVEIRPFTSNPPASKNPKKKVFLGGLSPGTTAETIKRFFERYGEISRVHIPINTNTKKPKGIAFIYFKNEDSVEKCVSEDFAFIEGRRVFIKKAEPHTQVDEIKKASVESDSESQDYDEMENQSVSVTECSYSDMYNKTCSNISLTSDHGHY